MKICITGFSGCGKTTLAKKLQKKFGFQLFHSDFVLSKYDLQKKKRTKLSHREYMKKVNRLNDLDSWIFEGRHILPQVLDQADVIIWLKPHILKSLFWQWKRYFTDIEQRKRFTFFNNIELSKNITFQQYLGREDSNKIDDPRHTPNEKYIRILSKYGNKVKILRTQREIDQLINTIS